MGSKLRAGEAYKVNGKTHTCWRCGKTSKAWLTNIGVMMCKPCVSKAKVKIEND
jgi:hypothetical protein